MTRPLDWYPLAASDPVPGDPDVVLASGQGYQDVAVAIGVAAQKLRTIASMTDMESDAVDAIAEHAGEIAGKIATVQGRYQAAGDALVTYSGALRDAQGEADGALADAREAQADYDTANHRHVVYGDPANANLPGAQAKADQASRAMSAASTALTNARHRLERATGARDTAAGVARDAIDRAVKADKVHDGWWQNVRAVVNTVTDIASSIAAVAGVLSLVLGWVPGLGEALAAVALVAGAVALVGHALQLAGGEGSWVDLGLDVLGLATFGLGRVAGAALKVGAKGVQGAARVRADAFVRVTGQSRGIKSAVRGLLGGKGLEGIMAGRRGLQAFVGRGPLLRTALRELNPVRATADVFRDLKGFSETGAFLRNPAQTWRSAFADVKGVRNSVLAFLGSGDEARAVSSVDFADPAVRNAATHLPEHAAHALRDTLETSKGQLDAALKYAKVAGGVSFVGPGLDSASAGYSMPGTVDTAGGLVDQVTGRDPLNLD